jgi:hypothetical protein
MVLFISLVSFFFYNSMTFYSFLSGKRLLISVLLVLLVLIFITIKVRAISMIVCLEIVLLELIGSIRFQLQSMS